MRAAAFSSWQQQAQALQDSPLEQYRRDVRATGTAPRPAPPPLDTAMFTSSPLQDFAAEVRHDLVYDPKPLVPEVEPIDTVHTPPLSRGSYSMLTLPGLHLRADLGPLLWIHAERGAPGQVGALLNEVA
ncbi:hypothetical protein [Pelomonas sp. KK5]|uniref:hypothetical protein n=1 Tax=Pelomonas sp. KK5 TaxID=1855730 RepID=UPI00097C3B13|nr:hypothetical protein [Pelomonas sp. KK5]